MPEITAAFIAFTAGSIAIGAVIGWIIRGGRNSQQKIAGSEGGQRQPHARQSEYERLLAQNKTLLEQVSQLQASGMDASNRGRELSDALEQAFERRDQLQRELKEIRSSLERAIRQRAQLQPEVPANEKSTDATRAAPDNKDEKIFRLSLALQSWQDRLPPLIERFRKRDSEAKRLEEELTTARKRIDELERVAGIGKTRIEPAEQDALGDELDVASAPPSLARTVIEEVIDEPDSAAVLVQARVERPKGRGVSDSWRVVASVAIVLAASLLIAVGASNPATFKKYSCGGLGLWCAEDGHETTVSIEAGITQQERATANRVRPDVRDQDRPARRYPRPDGVTFQGVVTDTYGLPMEGVEIRPRGSTFVVTRTNADGEFVYTAVPRTATVLYLSKSGYRDANLSVRAPADLAEGGAWRETITMTAAGDAYAVDGHVIVEKQVSERELKAVLQSPRIRTRYEVPVGDDGYYRFPAVEGSDDYRLQISGEPNLRSVVRSPIEILGPTTLTYAILEPVRTANLWISVRDASDQPVANRDFEVIIESNTRIKKKVTTGHDGIVMLANVPEGSVSLVTHGNPRLEFTGVEFSARQDETIAVNLNIGDRELQGRVLDSTASPVAGAVVEISGSERHGEATSRFWFRTYTDGNGGFRFSRLAQGKHELRVRTNQNDTLLVDAGPQDTPITLVLHDG